MTPLLVLLAVATGAAATFNPCGVGLLPSYVALLVGRPSSGRWQRGLLEGLAVGGAMTLGLLLLYLPVAAAFGAVAGAIGRDVPALGVGVGLLVSAWGLAILVWPERFLIAAPLPHGGAARGGGFGAVAYGFAFGLASLGCTFPLFVSLLFQASAAGSVAGGALVVLAYAIGMGVTVTALAVLARLARRRLERLLGWSARLTGRLAGAVVLLSGAFVVAYWLGLPS